MAFLRPFSPKIGLSVRLNNVFFFLQTFVVLKKNWKWHLVFCYKNKHCCKCYVFTIKPTPELFHKVARSNEKKWSKIDLVRPFLNFFLEKSLYLTKNEKSFSIFNYKNRNTYKFHAFQLKWLRKYVRKLKRTNKNKWKILICIFILKLETNNNSKETEYTNFGYDHWLKRAIQP